MARLSSDRQGRQRVDDQRFLAAAIRLGRRHLGRAAPNPAVGALIVQDGVVIGAGATQPGGRPHAEVMALAMAGAAAQGASAYVSLEPCAHHGKTPPCAAALIKAGVARVIFPLEDPDARVAGEGAAMLRAAGIEVVHGLCVEDAAMAHAGHILARRRSRPFVTMKLAVSADGFIAAAGPKPVAITGAMARAHSHMLRATHDAILVGIGTVLADDPALTCRLPGMAGQSPVRIVLDPAGRMPDDCRLMRDDTAPIWVVTTSTFRSLSNHVRVLHLEAGVDGFDIGALLGLLKEQGITRLLVEGGAHVARGFVRARLADDILIYRGQGDIGAGGLPPFVEEGLAALATVGAYIGLDRERLGDDELMFYRRAGLLAEIQ